MNGLCEVYMGPVGTAWFERHADVYGEAVWNQRTMVRVGEHPGTCIVGRIDIVSDHDTLNEIDLVRALHVSGDVDPAMVFGVFEGLEEAAVAWDTRLDYSPEVRAQADGMGIALYALQDIEDDQPIPEISWTGRSALNL